ncbi:hypothetical protein [Streptomyces colonosanans]|uniref:Uncharacterized protein n=1 Tax=Streptomyces colonosanans TaxID=1428652 RepID=A0A1S2PGA5_9ACTN|nr:hypothetical protein [Streptomyces colonosanans]OIJ92811.1 hypothetical protein BIV24_12785 [Streptomyces colonosanans]
MQPPQASASDRPTADDMTLCVEELRDALAVHGITLPSLRVDLPSFAAAYRPPAGLIALGNCNTATGRKLAEVLRKAAER